MSRRSYISLGLVLAACSGCGQNVPDDFRAEQGLSEAGQSFQTVSIRFLNERPGLGIPVGTRARGVLRVTNNGTSGVLLGTAALSCEIVDYRAAKGWIAAGESIENIVELEVTDSGENLFWVEFPYREVQSHPQEHEDWDGPARVEFALDGVTGESVQPLIQTVRPAPNGFEEAHLIIRPPGPATKENLTIRNLGVPRNAIVWSKEDAPDGTISFRGAVQAGQLGAWLGTVAVPVRIEHDEGWLANALIIVQTEGDAENRTDAVLISGHSENEGLALSIDDSLGPGTAHRLWPAGSSEEGPPFTWELAPGDGGQVLSLELSEQRRDQPPREFWSIVFPEARPPISILVGVAYPSPRGATVSGG